MYINFYFKYIPKFFMALSLVLNPIYIYLNLSDEKNILGSYRYFLLSFSMFNTAYTIVEALVPVAVYGADYVLIVYLKDGIFFESSFGQLAVSIRCGFIALSYAILTIHFFYRYYVLFDEWVIEILTRRTGVIILFLFFITHGVVWTIICELMMYATDDARKIAGNEFETLFHTNISKVSFLNIVYRSPNKFTVYRCWVGVSILSMISGISITIYCILGYKIVAKLRELYRVSKSTRQLQQKLFVILAVQTVIPTVLSFLPCMIVWFIPFFGVHIGNYGNIGMIALSAFPSLDALAIMLLLPFYRRRFISWISGLSDSKMTGTPPVSYST